uniref:Bromo domain-containing protein n=1 Tax=Percolomonas cosmopolitus TaxID=63605 RepID=A0A7S1PK60_9EUKA|mmetsp:Transcript_8215/g.30331  ORF Transcript_8215/g.30331 Transcript_8215/m.30331 type:complete len:759 (+) Transcript_8215:353-2629(+)
MTNNNIVKLSLQKRKRDDIDEDDDYMADEADQPTSLRIKVKKPKKSSTVNSSKLFSILTHVFKSDTSQIFWYEVDEQSVPGYHKVIKKPMWLLRIRDNLEKQEYDAAGPFLDSLKLMFDNAKKFNPKGTFFHNEALRMQNEVKQLRKGVKKTSDIVYDQTEPDPLPQMTELELPDEDEDDSGGFALHDEEDNSEYSSHPAYDEEAAGGSSVIEQMEEAAQENSDKFIPKVTRFGNFPKVPLDRLQSIMKRLFERLRLEDTYRLFMHPPNPNDYPEYQEKIGFPMDFATIQKKLDHGEIRTWTDFDYLLEVVFANTRYFYSKDTVYHDEAIRVQNFLRTTRNRMIDKLHRNFDYPLNQLVPAFTPRNTKRLDKFRSRMPSMKHQEPGFFSKLADSSLVYASRLDNTRFFNSPIPRDKYPDFYTKIPDPVHLELVQQHLEEDKFKTYKDFRDEMESVYENAIKFFSPENIHYKEAKYILEFVKQRNDELEQMLRLSDSLPPPPANVMRAYLKKTHGGEKVDSLPISKRAQRELMRASRRSTRNSRAIEEYEQEQITPDVPFTSTVLRAHRTKPAESEDVPSMPDSIFNSLMPRVKYVTKSYTVPLTQDKMSDQDFNSIANTSLVNMFERCKASFVADSFVNFVKRQRESGSLSEQQMAQNQENTLKRYLQSSTNAQQDISIHPTESEYQALSTAQRNRMELNSAMSELGSDSSTDRHHLESVLADLEQIPLSEQSTDEFQSNTKDYMRNRLKNIVRESGM